MFKKYSYKTSILCAVLVLAMGACRSPETYVDQANQDVYRIIDKKWDEDFGRKANYLISDIEPDANELQVIIPESGMLSLVQAVAIATAHNRDYQGQREQLYLKALDLTGERHKYVCQWFGSLGLMYSSDDGDEETSTDAELGIDRTFIFENGITVGAGVAIDWMRFLIGGPRTTLESILSADVAIPILGRGAGKVAWENLTQSEQEVLYQIRTFSRFRKSFVVSIVSDYYRVLQLNDAVINSRNSLESKKKLTERLRMEAGEGRLARFQVDQSEQSELAAKDRYLRQVRTFERRLDSFKDRLSLPLDSNCVLDQNELTILTEHELEMTGFGLTEAFETALERRLDLMNTADRITDAARKVELASEGLGVQLDLVGSARIGSRPDIDFANFQFHRGNYGLGLAADLPLDRLLDRNAYREASIVLMQRSRGYEQAVSRIKLEVREAYRRLEEEAESFQTALKSLELARMRVNVSPLLWAAQRMNTRDLLEAQDDLLVSEDNVTSSMIDFTIAKLEFCRDVGILNVRPDGMWEQHEYARDDSSFHERPAPQRTLRKTMAKMTHVLHEERD
ncbi:TolC family protein [Planctomycetota bacterium]